MSDHTKCKSYVLNRFNLHYKDPIHHATASLACHVRLNAAQFLACLCIRVIQTVLA
jgi:hypothetical protein